MPVSIRTHLPAVLWSCLVAVLPSGLRAQSITKEQFRVDFSKGLEYEDPKMMDAVLKKDRAAPLALQYFEELYIQLQRGHADVKPKVEALKASWERSFEKSGTMLKLQRWVDGMSSSTYDALQRGRANSAKLWEWNSKLQSATRAERLKVMQDFMQLATNAAQLGHSVEVAELWGLAGVAGNQAPDKTLEDRKEVLRCTEEFLKARRDWEFTFDVVYLQSAEFQKAEKLRIEELEKAGQKRKAEGYNPNAKGIDAYLVPGAKDDVHTLTFEALTNWDSELDYGPKNGPLPPLWWNMSLAKEGTLSQMVWFRRSPLYLARLGANKFGISIDPNDLKKAVEVDVGAKGKPSSFWLDNDKKVPYSMFFWAGSDKEKVGEAECNLSFTAEQASIYYRSAASWKTMLGTESIVFYDDNCNGQPADADVFEPPFKVATLGDHSGEGTDVPLFDSMRIGKGPRMPYSEFVKLATGWFHLRRDQGNAVLRPLNPEYFKTGKIKLVWSGPKPTAPTQLVVQGAADFKTAFFDVAGGKEVEVPAGEYKVLFGRIVVGKGTRAQLATIYQGASKPALVEPGKTLELKMGAPFVVQFERQGEDTIDALKVMLRESSGCVLTELYGIALAPEVLAAKAEDGKGAQVVGKFQLFTDAELLNKAAAAHNKLGLLCSLFPMPAGYREGPMTLKVKMPGTGLKMGLSIKKHALFGAIAPVFQ